MKTLNKIRIEVYEFSIMPAILREDYAQYLLRTGESIGIDSEFNFICAMRNNQKIAHALRVV